MFKFIIFNLIIVLSISCSSQKKVENNKKEMEIKKELGTKENIKTTKVYFLKDKKKYPLTAITPQVLLTNKTDKNNSLYTKEYDFNSDGKIDMIIVYNNKKEIEKIYSDLDLDLKHDVIDYYKNNKKYKREFLNYITRKPYIIVYYDIKGNITMAMFDRNMDSKMDNKSLYKNGLLYEVQIDSNSDGKFNVIKKIETKKPEEKDGK